jgi:hypothetical protein
MIEIKEDITPARVFSVAEQKDIERKKEKKKRKLSPFVKLVSSSTRNWVAFAATNAYHRQARAQALHRLRGAVPQERSKSHLPSSVSKVTIQSVRQRLVLLLFWLYFVGLS